MAARAYSGGAVPTTLAAAINSSGLTFILASSAGWPDGSTGRFTATLDYGLPTEEKVDCLSRALDVVTIAVGGRGYDGSAAVGHGIGGPVRHTFTAVDAQAANDHINGTTARHAATAIGFTPTGSISSTTVQAAVAEVATDVAASVAAVSEEADAATAAVVRARVNATLALPNLTKALAEYRDDLDPEVVLVGLGSSVEVGATLLDPAVDAPSAYLHTRLDEVLNRLGNADFTHANRGVNGSFAAGLNPAYDDAETEFGTTMKVAALVYGMNDGMPGGYHTGQTLPGLRLFLAAYIDKMRRDGVDPILFTTPHPHTGRTSWGYTVGTYPTVTAGGTSIPDGTYGQSIISDDWAGTGTNIPASYRHARVNACIRTAAADFGVPLIDVEHYWFEAVASEGEDALFDVGQNVHPNDLGHELSYHRAIDAFADSLAYGDTITQREGIAYGSRGLNVDIPTAADHVKNGLFEGDIRLSVGSTDPNTGISKPDAELLDDDGNLTLLGMVSGLGLSFFGATPAAPTAKGKITQGAAAPGGDIAPQVILDEVPAGEFGLLLLTAVAPGIPGRNLEAFIVVGSAARVQITSLGAANADVDLFSVAVSGRDVVATGLASTPTYDFIYLRSTR